MIREKKYHSPLPHLLNPGHSACPGCGMIIAARLVLEAAGPKTIVVNATGCSEVTTTKYPRSAFKIPWIHSLFENSAAVASGIQAALRHQGKAAQVNVLAIGGDGATFDIGFGLISGMWARGENILYVCYDNEAYQNTGYQASASTPWGAATTTTPAGRRSAGSNRPKKDLLKIALAHNLPYVAGASVGYPDDLIAKVKKALEISGPKYLQIQTPCVPGWGIDSDQTIAVAQSAVKTGLTPVVEYIRGKSTKVRKIKPEPVENFLKLQKRFNHLFSPKKNNQVISEIQKIADTKIKEYSLIQ